MAEAVAFLIAFIVGGLLNLLDLGFMLMLLMNKLGAESGKGIEGKAESDRQNQGQEEDEEERNFEGGTAFQFGVQKGTGGKGIVKGVWVVHVITLVQNQKD